MAGGGDRSRAGAGAARLFRPVEAGSTRQLLDRRRPRRGTGGGGGQGGGLGLGPSAENLTITQTATSLTIEERWASGGLARRVYPLDGRQANNTLGAGRGPTATSSSTWINRKLVTTLAVTSNGSSRELQETRSLDDKGRLVVETMAPGRPNSRRSVYSKVK